MKKTLLILLVGIVTISASAQTTQDETPYKGIESYRDLNLSTEQINKIKKLKREAGLEFAAIGKDRSLLGYEKGQRKRERAQKLRADIEEVLTKEQRSNWEKKHGEYTSLNDIKDKISDNFEKQSDVLETKYKADVKAVENNLTLSKEEIKAQKKSLKDNYKAEKKSLKEKRNRAKSLN